jgi:hypothetical protein
MTVPDHRPAQPLDPMRMLADIHTRLDVIDTRLMALEQNLFNVLDVLNRMLADYRLVENDYRFMPVAGEQFVQPDDEARRHGEKLARAIREVSR